MFDHRERRRRLSEEMRADGVDLLFLGLSSDGRTVVAGEPPAGLTAAYEVMLAAFEAGRAACRPGALSPAR